MQEKRIPSPAEQRLIEALEEMIDLLLDGRMDDLREDVISHWTAREVMPGAPAPKGNALAPSRSAPISAPQLPM